MPCVSRFYGISIYFYAGDHTPPHFHARYGGDDAAIDLRTGDILIGEIPPRALRLVREWALLHPVELLENWNRMQLGQMPTAIEPLR